MRKDEIFFFGDVDTHPDGGKIRDFAAERGMKCVCLGDGPLTDLGGMMIVSKKHRREEFRAFITMKKQEVPDRFCFTSACLRGSGSFFQKAPR